MKLYKEFYTLDDTLKIINTELQTDFNQSDLLEFWLLDYFDLFLRFKSVINDEAKFWDGEEIKVNFDLIKDELYKLNFDDETIEQEEIDVIGMYSDFENTRIEYIKTKQGNIDLIACNWMIVNKSTAEIKEDGIYIGSLSIGHDNEIINEHVPFLFSNIYITQKLPYSRFRVIKGDILDLIGILKRNAGLISEELQNPGNENQHLKTHNAQLEQEIARLQAEIAELKAQLPQAVENIEQYNNRERNTHLQIIGGLVEQLSKTGSKFRKKDNPNYYAIADTIASVTADYEDATKAETIRKRLAEAHKALTSEN